MKIVHMLAPAVALASLVLTTNVQAAHCVGVAQDDYLQSRYIFCRSFIAAELSQIYAELRLDGSDRALSLSDAEQFIGRLNALTEGSEDSDIDHVLSNSLVLRATIRGLMAEEVYSAQVRERYCAHKYKPEDRDNLMLPNPLEPEAVRDLDYFFGCGD